MPAIKLNAFGGMVPAQDDRLLPDQMAAYAENAWLYSGALQGMREPALVHTCTNPSARRVFRIPKDQVSKDYIVDSYWLEFITQDVDVVKAPMDNDTYGRFYWAGESDFNGMFPRYNTRARIATGDSYYKLGVPTPAVAPAITTSPSAPMSAANGFYSLGGISADLRYSKRTSAGRSLDRTSYSISPVNAVMAYRNSSNVTVYDALTESRNLDPNFPNTPGVSTTRILVSRAYSYTWVTEYGEEGPPSPPTVVSGFQDDKWQVGLTAPTTDDTTFRALSKVRIYRTVTSALGAATYFLVAEVPIATLIYSDTNTDDTVSSNNQLESSYWSAPPAGLQGIVSMPNGMIAGFVNNEIWFCEPFRPHAWPVLYTLSVDFNVVGLGVMGQTLIVCTESATYACTGVNPGAMSQAVIATNQPCLSRGGIVSTLGGVFYPSPDGIAAAVPTGVQVVTGNMISRDQWNMLLKVPRLNAALLSGAYYAYGTQKEGCFQEDCFQGGAFENRDYTGSYTGAFIAPTNERTSYIALASDVSTMSVFNDAWTGEVLIVRDAKVYHFNVEAGTHGTYTWKSKVVQVPYRRNLEALKVYFDVPDGVTGDLGTVRIYADDNLVWERALVTSGVMMRLPSGFKAEFWQVEVETRVTIWSVQMATSARELASV